MCNEPITEASGQVKSVSDCSSSVSSGYTHLPFRWFEYLKETKAVAAPVGLFNKVSRAEPPCLFC